MLDIKPLPILRFVFPYFQICTNHSLISIYLICLNFFPINGLPESVKWELNAHRIKWKATVISKLKTEKKQMRTGISILNRLISLFAYLINWYMNWCGQPIRAGVIIFANIAFRKHLQTHNAYSRIWKKRQASSALSMVIYSISHRWEPFSPLVSAILKS